MTYETSIDHLLAELDRIDTLLDGYSETLAGESVDRRLTTVGADSKTQTVPIPESCQAALDTAAETIATNVEQARAEDVRLRLAHLVEAFDLSPRHRDVLVLALAPDIDPAYQAQFRRLQGDDALDRPTVALMADLFGETTAETLAASGLVGEDSPLITSNLVQIESVPEAASSRLLRTVAVNERVYSYLVGTDALDPVLADTAALEPATASLDDLHVDTAVHERLTAVATDGSAPGRYYFYGPEGSGTDQAVEALTDTELLRADLDTVLRANALDRLSREAKLLDKPIHLKHADAVTDNSQTDTTLETVFDRVADLDTDVFVTGTDAWTPTETLPTEIDAIVEFPYPSIPLRQQFWEHHAAELPGEIDPEELAGTFRLTQGELDAALSTARSLADGDLTPADIYQGCRAQSAGELDDLAQHIEPASTWDDIELPAKTMRRLRIVRNHIGHQARIYSEWGFADQFSRGTGVVALFSGPSGTGKTMAAEILAHDTGMDLYKIDLSSVVSKYIGETEENLEEIFEAAENSNAILLFDEADAVFGDRAQVSDATDRYANVEVNYLLQRIESYDGVVLLTTNYESNIDSAFNRRIDHTVSFARPNEDTRDAIWEGIFPEDAPLGEIDYDFLSTFDLTGGQIKTVAQTAAILAADEERIGMKQIVRAIRLAAEKNDTMLERSDFGEYHHLLQVTSETSDDGESGTDEADAPDRTPEAVVRAFVSALASGDSDAIRALSHPRGKTTTFSHKHLARLSRNDISIVSDLERIRDDPDRVIVRFTQAFDGTRETLDYELRVQEGHWRVFDYEPATGDSVERVE